jgi:hypothetical protein
VHFGRGGLMHPTDYGLRTLIEPLPLGG